MDPGFLPRVLAAVDDEALVPDLVVSSEVAVTLVLPARVRQTRSGERVWRRSPRSGAARAARASCAWSGTDWRKTGTTRGRVLAALAAWDPELVALGGSATSVAALVPEARLDACVRALHREFFEVYGGMKYALVGYGKMGRAIEAAAAARGHSVGAIVDRQGAAGASSARSPRRRGAA